MKPVLEFVGMLACESPYLQTTLIVNIQTSVSSLTSTE